MAPPPHSKPENVLKRALELVAVDKELAALENLHEHVTSKRIRNSPIAPLEPVMLLFVELCVNQRKGKAAKEGLYNYKNIAQNTNVQTIELVLKKFIELAEQKVTAAQAKAEQINLDGVEDLEASETPESILLSTVSGEQAKDRTDRAVVTPWLKFLWETYRTVLDILRNNARLEIMYQSTALQAFEFCQKYARKTEFRRLCELLRNHVQNAAKYSTQMHAINLNDPETLQRHLDTRFQQLNVAVELELWQEAFRSVEDIHTLLNLSKRPPKPIMMANYYEKLTRIFLVSENYLFHAAAWSRYYNLLRSSHASLAAGLLNKKDVPSVTEADITRAASFVLLSSLSIPVISTSRSRGLLDVDEAKRTKNTRLTNLLGMSKAPTRPLLFKEALGRGLLQRASPEIRELYNILEVDFHPLSICRKISPILTKIADNEEMKRYIAPLHQVILTRLFQQLSQVYESVQLEFVIKLAQFPAPFEVSPATIEKFIMNGCKKGELSIRIDHAAGVLSFDSDVFSSSKTTASSSTEKGVQKLQSTPSEIVRSQLSRLSKALYLTCSYVDPSFLEAKAQAKEAAFARAAAGAEKEHQEALARRNLIEQRKTSAEEAIIKKEREEQQQRMQRQQEIAEAEAKRLAEQQKQRELARMKAEQERIRKEELQKQLDELKSTGKLDVDLTDLSDMDAARLRQMKLQQLEKEKKELAEKLRITGKRVDHLERAYRREEVKLLPKDYEQQLAADKAAFEERQRVQEEAAKRKHEEDVALKKRLERLVPTYEQFRDHIREQRAQEFQERREAAERELNAAIERRRTQVREKRAAERRAAEEAERKKREEEEQARREEEEKARKEEELRARLLAEKKEREEENARLEEIARKQRQREQEVEERRARERAEKLGRSTEAPAPNVWRPRRDVTAANDLPPSAPAAGETPRWRPRRDVTASSELPPSPASPAAAPAAASPAAAPAAPPAAESPRPGAYRPGMFKKARGIEPQPEAPPTEVLQGGRSERPPRDGPRPAGAPERREFNRSERPAPEAREPRGPREEKPEGSGTPPAGGKYRPPGARTGGAWR